VVAFAAALPASAQAAPRISITAKPAVAAPSAQIAVTGRVKGLAARPAKQARILLEERSGSRWAKRSTARLGRRGVFTLKWQIPATTGRRSLRLRLVRGRRTLTRSAAWPLEVSAPATATPPTVTPVTVATGTPTATATATATPPPPRPAQTQVLAGGLVLATPAPGTGGELRLDGTITVTVGDVLASGIGPNSPYGFLLKATAVRSEGGQTVVDVVPATLLEALPQGHIDATVKLEPLPGRALKARSTSRLSCESGGTVTIDGSAELGTPDLDIDVDWGFLKVNSAEITASITASAFASAAAEGAASCSVGPIEIAEFKFAPFTIVVGGLPVVFFPEVDVELSGLAGVEASVKTSISASATAKAGARFGDGGFTPIAEFSKSLNFVAPAPTASATLSGTVSPQLEVLVYGAVGPEFSLNAGFELTANPTLDPWWTLDGVLSVTAELEIPVLDLQSGPLTVFAERIRLAEAPSQTATAEAEIEFDVTETGSAGAQAATQEGVACTLAAQQFSGHTAAKFRSTAPAELTRTATGDWAFEFSDTAPEVVSSSFNGPASAECTGTGENEHWTWTTTTTSPAAQFIGPGSSRYEFVLPRGLKGQPTSHGQHYPFGLRSDTSFGSYLWTRPSGSVGFPAYNTRSFTGFPLIGEGAPPSPRSWTYSNSLTVDSAGVTPLAGTVTEPPDGRTIVIEGGATYTEQASAWRGIADVDLTGPYSAVASAKWKITVHLPEAPPAG